MSSRRRRSRDKSNQADAFNQDANPDTGDTGSLEDFTNMMYNSGIGDELRRADSAPTRIKKIPLDKIVPDPIQARRVMPRHLRRKWIENPGTVVEVLNEWLTHADQEAALRKRPPIDVRAMLERDPENNNAYPEEDDLEPMGPSENSFRAMVQLAASIRHHGLANPVTVVSHGSGYQLETGERRLLAFNLLHSLPQEVSEATFETIPARVVETKSMWRQAAENGARQDLNAISVARQLALLLMDVYQEKHTFAPPSVMPDRDWYAQVYNSKKFPVPYGRGAELAAAIGLKSGNQIRQYRQLLDLPGNMWDLADTLDWTEYKIRKMRTDAKRAAELTLDYNEEDILIILARKEAGILKSLPVEIDAALGNTKATKDRSGDSSTTTGSSSGTHSDGRAIARGLPCIVDVVNVQSGLLTLHVEDPEVLRLLESGERVIISIKRDGPQE